MRHRALSVESAVSIRSRRAAIAVLTSLLALSVGLGAAAPAAAATWTAPARIPGTIGLANSQAITAPDGTDVVLWGLGSGSGTINDIHAKVRLPGSTRWRTVPQLLSGDYVGITSMVATPDGDVWVAGSTGSVRQQIFVRKLDTTKLTWSPRSNVFDASIGSHMGAKLGRAADGTLVVAAVVRPDAQPGGDPVYRVEVGIRHPGGTWRTRFLSPADAFAVGQDLAVNADGAIAISFIDGYELAKMRVKAATLGAAAGARWKIATLSSGGSSQRAHVALGADGTAAVAWSTPASAGFTGVEMATRETGRALAPWVGQTVVNGRTGIDVDAWPTVESDGSVDVVWRESGRIWLRRFTGATSDAPIDLSPAGVIAELDAIRLRRDDRIALLYQLFTGGAPLFSEGLRFRLIDHGTPGIVTELTGDQDTSGNANSENMWLDRHGRPTIVYTRGDYPDTDFAWLEQRP